MRCSLGFVSDLTYLRSGVRLESLVASDIEPIAVCDNANLGNIVQLAKSGKRFLPAVELFTTLTYDQSGRPSAPVVLYAFNGGGYRAICNLVAEANRHKRYGGGRVEVAEMCGVLSSLEDGDAAAVVPPDYEYLDELGAAAGRVYLCANAAYNSAHSAYARFPAIYWHRSHALDAAGLRVLSLLKGRGEMGGHDYFAFDDESHFDAAKRLPSAIENYRSFLDRASAGIVRLGADRTPKFDVADPPALFEALVRTNFPLRYPAHDETAVRRMEFELETIKSFGFADYFLVLHDMVSWARRNGISVGPGRGSAAGSMVAYILGINRIEPLSMGLMFERFLNPGRKGSYPDIDIDVESGRRDEVIGYLVRRYGFERVSAVVTHNTLGAKLALKDAARIPAPGHAVPRVSNEEMNRLTKAMPRDTKIGLGQCMGVPEVDDFIRAHPDVWGDAKAMEGFRRQAGVHPSALIVAPEDLKDVVGLDCNDGVNVCQLIGVDAEDFGLLKLDLLGVETIDILARTCRMIGGDYRDLEDVPLDDAAVYRSLHTGNGIGIFQFEGDKVQQLLAQVKPLNLTELATVTALNRPGPLQSGLTDDYLKNRNRGGRNYLFPEFETLLGDTCGVFVFQEQVMLVAQKIASFSLTKADTLRKAIGKKKHDLMDSLEREFIEGAVANGHDVAKVRELWAHIVGFADYCFNKSHSVAYSTLSYWCAYLRHHHPREFAASYLTSNVGRPDKLRVAIPRFGQTIKYHPPDVNDPSADFRPYRDGVQIGLSAIKGMGEVANRIAACAPFGSLGDLCDRAQPDKTQLQRLCLTGALDCFGDRDVVHGNLDRAMKYGKEAKKVFFTSLFDEANTFALHKNLKKPAPRDTASEVVCYGFTVFQGFLAKNSWWLGCVGETTVVGMVVECRPWINKKGDDMAFLKLETVSGEIDLTLFHDVWREHSCRIHQGRCCAFKVRRDTRQTSIEERERFIADDVLGEAQIAIKSVLVHIADSAPDEWPEGKTPLCVVAGKNWRGDRRTVDYTKDLHIRLVGAGARVEISVF